MQHLDAARAIYGPGYAESYGALYIEPWAHKHDLNRRRIEAWIDRRGLERPRWLDLACGQAWHFGAVRRGAQRVGLDASLDQLRVARGRRPGDQFVQADMGRSAFDPASFDLVTSFWGAYCYLDDTARILRWFQRARDSVRAGGALYVEVLLAEDLASFNRSKYAGRTAFRVEDRGRNFERWAYRDSGGWHSMTSPPLERFLELVEGHFEKVEAVHDGRFMVHLMAEGKRPSCSSTP